MDFLMLSVDLLIVMALASMLKYSYAFTRLSIKNKEEHNADVVTQMHFQDHAVAVIFSFVGSSIGLVGGVYHIFCQHIVSQDTYWAEIVLTSGITILIISGLVFMRHMICEETPGHPYYIREYNQNPSDRLNITRDIESQI